MNKYALIVDDYIRDHQHNAEREQRWFKIQPSLTKAIENAALAKGPGGMRLSHQRRIPDSVLHESNRRLQSRLSPIQDAKSFDELHRVVESAIRPIAGIGELTVYDTALRIGAYLDLEPEEVFLHAGTRAGAERLGLDPERRTIPVDELPSELRALKAMEVEDVLCIYKHRLGSGNGANPRRTRC